MESKASDLSAPSSTVSNQGNGDATSSPAAAADGEYLKCRECKKRLGRRNCSQQACVKCCSNPNCEPHREARDSLQRKQSILDGTDYITRAAAQKRASKVTPGMFFDSNIQYFGETVVIWNVREFMDNPKWREDAIRRSRNRNERGGHSGAGVELLSSRKRRRDKSKEGEQLDATTSLGDSSEKQEILQTKSKTQKKPMSRKKRFKAICNELYQKSLIGK